MKYFFTLLCILTVSISVAQTKLIHHKSHSGTNASFNPHNVHGNFGYAPQLIIEEYKKDTTSSYKLISSGIKGEPEIKFILFKTENKTLDKTMCMVNDEVIETVSIITGKLHEKIKNVLIEELQSYRKNEK